MPYTPPPEPYKPQVEFQQQVQEIADKASENQRRREEIGYRIDDYPQQTTSQPK